MSDNIEWPYEDVVLEICWDGDPYRVEIIPREFLPDKVCEYCKYYNGETCTKGQDHEDKEPDDSCDDWEWNEDTNNLLDEPREPKREEYRTEWAYKKAKEAVRKWYYTHPRED